ncbi:hypothetical protein LTR48_009345, partial [Friedmanniomyces endolithicus]
MGVQVIKIIRAIVPVRRAVEQAARLGDLVREAADPRIERRQRLLVLDSGEPVVEVRVRGGGGGRLAVAAVEPGQGRAPEVAEAVAAVVGEDAGVRDAVRGVQGVEAALKRRRELEEVLGGAEGEAAIVVGDVDVQARRGVGEEAGAR